MKEPELYVFLYLHINEGLMGGEREAEGALFSLPTASVCSQTNTGERHWLMVYIKIKLLPLLEQKEV